MITLIARNVNIVEYNTVPQCTNQMTLLSLSLSLSLLTCRQQRELVVAGGGRPASFPPALVLPLSPLGLRCCFLLSFSQWRLAFSQPLWLWSCCSPSLVRLRWLVSVFFLFFLLFLAGRLIYRCSNLGVWWVSCL
jgi:hypothetical protein